MSALVRNTHSFSKDRIDPQRWLDKQAVLNQPPHVDDAGRVGRLGQGWRGLGGVQAPAGRARFSTSPDNAGENGNRDRENAFELRCLRPTERGGLGLTSTSEPAAPARQPTAGRIPENAHLQESAAPGPGENGPIVEVAFKPANPRFRESSAKPPRKRPNAERRSREFLSPAEVEKLIEAAQRVGSARAAGRDHDPDGLPPRTTGQRAYRAALGPVDRA